MAHRDDDEWDVADGDWSGDDFPEETDFPEDDEAAETIPCPYCGREIHEDAPRCPDCERYLSGEDAPPARLPTWKLVGVLLCLYAVYRWIIR